MVVLAGYKTVKEALVNHAEEFGERDTFLISREQSQGHGKEIKRASTKYFSPFSLSPSKC